MTFAIKFDGKQVGAAWRQKIIDNQTLVARATTQATKETVVELERRLHQDMREAGKFGPRWEKSLKIEVKSELGGLNAVIDIRHKIPYAAIFETGGTIRGKPLLWLPLSYTGFKGRPRDYPGGLFFVKSKKGQALLLSLRDRLPKFFGITSVHIPKLFRFHAICQEVAKGFKARYQTILQGLKRG